MNKDLLVLVTTHGGYPTAHKNHMPLWASHNATVVTVFPAESSTPGVPASFEAHPRVDIGKSEKGEPLTTERFKEILKWYLENGQSKHVLLYSQATIPLEPKIPEKYFKESEDRLWGAFAPMPEDQVAQSTVPQFPVLMSRAVAKAVYDNLAKTPITVETKYWNQAIGQLVSKQLIKVGSFGKLAFVRDSIEGNDEVPMLRAIAEGAIFIHGVRSDVRDNRMVRMCQSAYNDAQAPRAPLNVPDANQQALQHKSTVRSGQFAYRGIPNAVPTEPISPSQAVTARQVPANFRG